MIGFPGGSVIKNSSANAGDMGSNPGSERSPREENGNPLQYSCLGNHVGKCDGQFLVFILLGPSSMRPHLSSPTS